MTHRKQKLEPPWIGKENRPRLEPRVLVEEPEYSCHADQRVTDNDPFDNILIHGDNLLALKALEQEVAGKCLYIAPAFDTGTGFSCTAGSGGELISGPGSFPPLPRAGEP